MAEELLEEYFREHPNDLAMLIHYAEIAWVCKKWMQAKEQCKRVLEAAELVGEPLHKIAIKRLEELE